MARDPRRPSSPGRRASGRPVPPSDHGRRLRRDRILGGVPLVLGTVVLVLNLVMEFAPRLVLLPGGHQEPYFVAALLTAGTGAWIVFDWGNTRSHRR